MRPLESSTARCAGVQPERPPTEPEPSSACRNAWLMNGLNRSPSASSNDRPGGLAQASHAAASMAAMDGTTRAVKVEDMGGQAVRSGGIAHLSTHGASFVAKGLKPGARVDRPRPETEAHTGSIRSRGASPAGSGPRNALRRDCAVSGELSPSSRAAASTRLLEIDNHAEIAGFCLSVRNVEALRRQTPPQQFANRRCAARHVTAEPPLIEGGKLL